MKKLISSKKIVAVLLCFAMLLPLCVIGTTAATAKVSYNNLFGTGTQGYSWLTTNPSYWTSDLITVSQGDVIYFGPVVIDQGFQLTSYSDAAGTTFKEQQIKLSNANVELVEEFTVGNVGIAKWTVPAGTLSFKFVASQMFYDIALVTKNQSFDVQSYLAYAVSQGKNVDYLKPTTTAETLNNVFPRSDSVLKGYVTENGTVSTDNWWKYATSDYISVTKGDTLYFTGYVPQDYHLALYDANKTYITDQSNSTKDATVGVNHIDSDFLIEYEDLGRDYMIYAYHIGRSNVKYVRVIASRGMYGDDLELVTINQPFTGKQYRKLMGLPESIVSRVDPKDSSSPLNGKRALYIGDSITQGFRDWYSYGRDGLSWASRIERDTGLDFVNPAIHGSTISYLEVGDSSGGYTATEANQGWNWIYDFYADNADAYFDMVVMHGGVNDARYTRDYGEVKTTNIYNLEAFDTSTFAGGLQYLFASVKQNFPEATLFYIANFRLDNATIKYGDTSKTLEQDDYLGNYMYLAYEICELYDINLIDLHNNTELNAVLETTKTTYLEDKLHPSPEGYEIITPYIIEEMEAVIGGNSFGVEGLDNPLAGVAVGGSGSSVTAPSSVPSSGYDVWDGVTYDTEWESAGDQAYYIQSAAELAGLKKVVDDAAATNTAAWIAAAEEALTTNGANATDPGYGNYIHAYAGYTFYVTVNIDLNNYDWDGIGTHDNWSVFRGTIAGAANKTAGEMVYIKGLKVVYDSTDNLGTVTTSTISEKSFSVTNTVQGVGFVTIQSGGGMKDLTFVDPTATQAIQRSAIVVGRTRTSTCTYDNVHVVGGTFTLANGTSADYDGCFLGGADGKTVIQNCSVTNTQITYSGTVTPGAIGGIVGGVSSNGAGSRIENCYSDVDINYYGGTQKSIGGVLGYITGSCSVINCSYVGTLNLAIASTIAAGGIVGRVNGAGGTASADGAVGTLIEGCKADFTCKESFAVTKMAGIVGYGNGSGHIKISNCSADVDFSAAASGSEQFLCGIVGYGSGTTFLTITTCSSTGNIIVTGSKQFRRVGGILGSVVGNGAKITQCMSDIDIESQITKDPGTIPAYPTPPADNASLATWKEYYATEAYQAWANWYKNNTNSIDAYEIGGIVGLNTVNGTEITSCVFTGSIRATRKSGVLRHVGGILGSGVVYEQVTVEDVATNTEVFYSVIIRNCMATCTIAMADAGSYNHGVVDEESGLSVGFVETAGQIGGIAGFIGGTDCVVSDCSVSVTFDFKGEAKNVEGVVTDPKTGVEEKRVIYYAGNFQQIGGIIGMLSGSLAEPLANCVVQGMISLQDGQFYSGAHLYQSGAVVGRNNGSLTVQNIKVTFVVRDTSVTATKDVSDTVAGVIGFADGPATVNGATVTFRHFLTTPYTATLAHYGGVIGRAEEAGETYRIQNCVVDYELHAEKASYDVDGAGGLVGTFTDGILTIDNCYTTGRLNNVKYAGGILGRTYTQQLVTIQNTQAEMIVNGTSTQCGGFIGRLEGPLTMTGCLLTGVSSQEYDGYYGFGWIGLLSSNRDSANDAITITNCYSNSNFPVFPSMDYLNNSNSAFTMQINLNGSMYPATAPTTYYRGELISAPTNIQDCKNLSGGVWTTYTDGTNPILTIAKDVNRPYGKADLHWFDPLNDFTRTVDAEGNETFTVNKTGYTFNNAEETIGMAMISHVEDFYNDVHSTATSLVIVRDCFIENKATGEDYTLLVDYRVHFTVAGICAHHRTFPGLEDTSYCTGKVVTFESLNIYKQVSAASNGNDDYVNIRLIATVETDLAGYNTAGFRITNVALDKTITKSFTTVYQSVITPSGTLNAPEGYYYFAYEMYNVPKDMVIEVEAFVEYHGCAAYGILETIYVNQLAASASAS